MRFNLVYMYIIGYFVHISSKLLFASANDKWQHKIIVYKTKHLYLTFCFHKVIVLQMKYDYILYLITFNTQTKF